MSLVGLDLNATRVRAVRGLLGDYPGTVALEAPAGELPLALNLEGRVPVLGSAALRVCRLTPHLVWQNFLPRLGEASPQGRKWVESRHRLDAAKALQLTFQQLLRVCRETTGAVLALPAYLSAAQVATVLTLADQAGLPLLGSIATPLAAALAAHAEQAWFGATVVVDVDDQALMLATIGSAGGQAQLLDTRALPHLSLRLWRERLLNAVADCCILDTRWDPRESAVAEQALFDQLDELLDASQQGRMVKVTLQTAQRFQNLVLQAHDPAAFCAALRRQVLAEVESILTGPWPERPPATILVTAAAARLPGLVAALETRLSHWEQPAARNPKATASALEDFGSSLLQDSGEEPGTVVVLAADAAARGAHAVGAYFQRGDFACGHLPAAAPLPLPQPFEAGPARLHFQGRDYLLGADSFTLGRQPGVDLVFDGELWPNVAARHCEIVYDHRAHMLCNRSRHGTLVNDRLATQAVPLRPGDWIRLGPDGPLLRFLGQSADLRTTA
jgi:hypothetical protein